MVAHDSQAMRCLRRSEMGRSDFGISSTASRLRKEQRRQHDLATARQVTLEPGLAPYDVTSARLAFFAGMNCRRRRPTASSSAPQQPEFVCLGATQEFFGCGDSGAPGEAGAIQPVEVRPE